MRNIHCISLGLVVEVSSEESKEVVHLGLEQLNRRLALATTMALIFFIVFLSN
jgi:hypothetical protein